MKHFLIYTNQMKDKEYQITGEVKRLLEEKGQQVTLFSELKSGEIPVHMDAMLVLGGDGTVLQAVRETKTEPIPLIGINLGTLGFLAQIEPAGIEEALDCRRLHQRRAHDASGTGCVCGWFRAGGLCLK